MSSRLGRIAGCLAGFAIVILGLSLFTPEAGLPQTARVTALISVLIALGIGVMAASLLPNSITVDGEKIKPLGIGLNATGGAAFFIVTLVFLFYTDEPGAAKPDPTPPIATESAAPAPVATESVAAVETAAPVPTPTPPAPSLSAVAGAGPQPWSGAAPQQQPQAARLIRVRTFCSECCPNGPIGCPQVGWAQSTSADEAVEMAAQMCMANGGQPGGCYGNIENY